MAVPKRKVSRSRRNMRRSHDALPSIRLVQDKTTGELHLSHHLTPDGYYRGRCVLSKASKAVSVQDSDN